MSSLFLWDYSKILSFTFRLPIVIYKSLSVYFKVYTLIISNIFVVNVALVALNGSVLSQFNPVQIFISNCLLHFPVLRQFQGTDLSPSKPNSCVTFCSIKASFLFTKS